MNWKHYKTKFQDKYPDESQFIISIDIGDATSSIAYFDLNKKEPEVIDISGGYGKPNIPTIVQYDEEGDDWIFGEYALLNINENEDIAASSIIEDLGKGIKVPIRNHHVTLSFILSQYINELISNCKNLNPNANIAGIVVLVPNYFDNESFSELKQAFEHTEYSNYVISYSQDREAIFNRYYFENEVENEKILLLDFGSRAFRVGSYNVTIQDDNINVQCIMSMPNEDLGEDKLDKLVNDLFTKDLIKNTNKELKEFTQVEKKQLKSFLYTNKDLLFQKNITKSPIRLYYNFVYPPFQETYSNDEIEDLTGDFKNYFKRFIFEVLAKSAVFNNNRELKVTDINKVICTGGGFEMLWAKNLIIEMFGVDKGVFYKNSKTALVEGGVIIAAGRLNLIKRKNIIISDKNLLSSDVGFEYLDGGFNKFYPIAHSNSFWWSDFKPCIILVNENIKEDINITLMKKNNSGRTDIIETINIEGLPKRPKGTTKLQLGFSFLKNDLLKVTIEDFGFGEIYPKTDFKKDYIVSIN